MQTVQHIILICRLNFVVDNPNPIDDEVPELISFSIRDNTLELGETVFIDYEATDASGELCITIMTQWCEWCRFV